jgi:hypothetical protein
MLAHPSPFLQSPISSHHRAYKKYWQFITHVTFQTELGLGSRLRIRESDFLVDVSVSPRKIPLHFTGMQCFIFHFSTEHFFKFQNLMCIRWSPLWSSGQSSWLQIQRSTFDSRRYQIFWEVVGLERSPLCLVSTTEKLLERKSSGFGVESREYGRRVPPRWLLDSRVSAKVGSNFADNRLSFCRQLYRELRPRSFCCQVTGCASCVMDDGTSKPLTAIDSVQLC